MLTCATCRGQIREGAPFCAHCGGPVAEHAQAPAPDALVGQVLARKFRIHAAIGEGGMGRVYRAEQLPLGVDVVIKTLHPQLASDPMVVARFFREAQAASRLRHPNSISILDFGDADGTLYIAMEFLRGRSLARVLAEDGRFEPRRAIRIVMQVLDVLAAAHEIDIVHRDLKPDNIMVEDLATHRDFVKVLDFGIAKITTAGHDKLTRTGMVFGTPSYMAPEQATGGDIDGRTDLYAVGVIMFELLTGRVPFFADTLPMLLVAVTTTPAPPLLTIRDDVPPALAAIVDGTLAKSPDDRPATALDLKAALEPFEHGARAAAHPADAVAREFRAAQIPCPRCSQPIAATAKFCGECGAQLGRATPSELKDKLADLRRYLPTGIVDEISQLRVRAAGEKREVVALVIDITGAASGHDEPEEDRLAKLHAELGELALRNTGTLEHRPGSGTVILFGLIITHADDAERAVEAALDGRALVGKHNERGQTPLEVTCAIHGGTVVVEAGARGAAYASAGDTIDLPMRLAAAVASGKIVVTEKIQRLIRSSVELRQMPAIRLKGHAAAIPAFEVVSANLASRAAHVALARAPFVGRDDGLRAIVDAIEHAPRGQTIHITGEPGIGKSRLLEELVAGLAAKRQLVVAAPARPGPDRVSPTVARIVEALGGSIDALRAHGLDPLDVRALAAYVAKPVASPFLDDQARHAAVAASVRTAIELLARRAPVCVVIDDVHLADPLATAVIRRLVIDPIPRATVVTAARAGHALPWQADGEVTVRIATLTKLPDPAIEQIVAGALLPTPAPRELKEAVAARSSGSPLIALQVLRGMIDSGVLVSIGERWTVVGTLANVAKPEGLRALYAARIDALPAYARDVLACAAVIGDEIAIELLDRVVGQSQGTPIGREVRLLVARGWLADTTDGAKLRFAEPSAREAVYDRLVGDPRRQLHHAVATALEASQGVPEEVIGEHFELGGDSTRAFDWFARAVATAMKARELRRATAILRRSRALCQGGTTAATNRRLAEDSLRLSELLLELGELVELRAVIADGLACAHKDDDPMLIAGIRRARGRAALASGNLEAAITDLEAALAAAAGKRDRMMIAEVHGDLGEAHERRGDAAKATDYLLRALELVQAAPGDVQPVVLRLLIALGRVVLRNRDVDRAERFLLQALDLAEKLDDKLGASKVLGNLAATWHARGDHAKALEFANRALELSREFGDLIGVARQLTNVGTLCMVSGDVGAARRHYDAAFAQAQRAGWREGMASAAAARDRLSSAGTPGR